MSQQKQLDPKLASQLQESFTSVGVNQVVLKLTSRCFDICYGDYAPHKLPGSSDKRQETCVYRLYEECDYSAVTAYFDLLKR
uniref:Zf-Tim10_DDP domain-containing protein n=1 Tax=Meloidogyne hapla TaxID=6305 RepID=A0A1I8BTZ0_MELHA